MGTFHYDFPMLLVRRLSLYNQRFLVRDHVDTGGETLVVADLQSKLDVKKYHLDRESFIEENAVQRVHDLWVQMLNRTQPQVEGDFLDAGTCVDSTVVE